jgi:hypothetical protein
MKPLAQIFIGEVKAAEVCCAGAGMPERKLAGIQGKGNRKYKK